MHNKTASASTTIEMARHACLTRYGVQLRPQLHRVGLAPARGLGNLIITKRPAEIIINLLQGAQESPFIAEHTDQPSPVAAADLSCTQPPTQTANAM